MQRGILLIAALTVSSAIFGYGQTTTTTVPANGPWGGPLLVTPITSFPSPAPTAGISDAGRAGISIENNGTVANDSNSGVTTVAPTIPATIVVAPVVPAVTNPTAANDLGPSAFVGGPSDASAPSTIGVAEVAIRYKSEKGTRNARVLDNEDVKSMLNNKNGVTLAKNMPTLDHGVAEHGGEAQNAGVQAGAPPAATQPSQQNTEANASASQGQSGASSPAAPSGQNQTGATDTQAENSTTPQINQNPQSNDAQGSRRLPATATFLPLLGLLGLVSGGIGFWFRKFRN